MRSVVPGWCVVCVGGGVGGGSECVCVGGGGSECVCVCVSVCARARTRMPFVEMPPDVKSVFASECAALVRGPGP